MSENRLTLPNVVTLIRIAVCPVIFFMALSPTMSVRFGAFALFVAAGLSDIWDGYLARRYDQITDVGKLLDPIADKFLLFVTFVAFFVISHRGLEGDLIPWWGPGLEPGPLPVWVFRWLASTFAEYLVATEFALTYVLPFRSSAALHPRRAKLSRKNRNESNSGGEAIVDESTSTRSFARRDC